MVVPVVVVIMTIMIPVIVAVIMAIMVAVIVALFVALVVAMKIVLPPAMAIPVRTFSAMRKTAAVAVARIVVAIDPAMKAIGAAVPRTGA